MVRDKNKSEEELAEWGSGPASASKLDLPDLSSLGEGNVEYFWRVKKRSSPHDTHVAIVSSTPFDVYLMKRTSNTVTNTGLFRKMTNATETTESVVLQHSVSGYGKYPTQWKAEVEMQARRILATFKAQNDIAGDYS